jgi:hypothetical protein
MPASQTGYQIRSATAYVGGGVQQDEIEVTVRRALTAAEPAEREERDAGWRLRPPEQVDQPRRAPPRCSRAAAPTPPKSPGPRMAVGGPVGGDDSPPSPTSPPTVVI